MKINVIRQNGILTLPSDFATLVALTNQGYFHYRVKFKVNVVRAVANRAFVVKVHATGQTFNGRGTSGFVDSNPRSVIDNLLTRQSRVKEQNRAFKDSYIASVVCDITSFIPNDKAAQLARLAAESSSEEQEVFLFEEKNIENVRAAALKEQNAAQPIYQSSIFQPANPQIAQSLRADENGMDLILRYGVDPASLGDKTGLYTSTEAALGGIVAKPRGAARDAIQPSSKGAGAVKASLLQTILGPQADRVANTNSLSANDITQVVTVRPTNELTITQDLFIPLASVGDQFNILFGLQNLQGIEYETVTGLVHHSRNLSIFTVPSIPPFMSVTPGASGNRIEIKQLDPNAVGVYLYRRHIEQHSVMTDADYSLITKMPIKPSEGTKVFLDRTQGLRPVIYRAIPYNRAEVKSAEFASVVLTPPQPSNLRAKRQRNIAFVSVSAKILDRSVQIEINEIPAGTISLQVYRRDLTRRQKLSEAERVGNIVYLVGRDRRFTVYVTDENPIDQRIYEYFVKMTRRDGSEVDGSVAATIHFNPVINNVITTRVSPIQATNVGSELDVVFTITSTISEGKTDLIQKAMQQQGILGFYQDDLVTNRDKLQSLIAYQIKRTNVTTGEVEDLGVFIGTAFSDRTIGKNRGVKPLNYNHTYEYTIMTHFRSADSLIETFETSVAHPTNADLDYSYKPSKWRHPVTLRDGNLVSSESLSHNYANSEFTFGTVGDIVHTRITLPDDPPTVYEPVARRMGNDKVLLQWKVKGSIKKVDHFIVIKEELGLKTVVGKAHGISENNTINFIESVRPDESRVNPLRMVSDGESQVTAATYHVVPVMHDYSHGPVAQTQQVVANSIR